MSTQEARTWSGPLRFGGVWRSAVAIDAAGRLGPVTRQLFIRLGT